MSARIPFPGRIRTAATRTAALVGVAALLLAGCGGEGDSAGGAGGAGGSGDFDPVATEMRSWDACDVLDDLKPIKDFMGIEEWVATISGKNEPDSAKWGKSTFDPDAIVCGAGIEMPSVDNMPSVGVLGVKIVPWENEKNATASYDTRISVTSEEFDQESDKEVAKVDIGEPWEVGRLHAYSTKSGSTDYVNVVVSVGQWLLHIDLDYTGDFGAEHRGKPDYSFTRDGLHKWLIETYLPETRDVIETKLAAAGVSDRKEN